eukprot:Skav204572  [mRNA]  locus=scaffold2218:209660:210874:- [translate_table: standard]
MNMLQPGDVCYLDYGEVPACVHSRLVLSEVDRSQHEFIILTPDQDIYCEVLHPSNGDLVAFHLSGPNNALPPGVPPAVIYGFRPMTALQLSTWMQDGRVEADRERATRGLPPLPGPAGVPGGVPQIWVLATMVEGHKVGEQVYPPPGFPSLGDYGLMNLADSRGAMKTAMIKRINQDDLATACEEFVQLARSTEASEGDDRSAAEDIRTMAIRYSANGDRLRSFKDSVAEMVECEMEDFPFHPRTCLEYLRAVGTVAESSVAQHNAWVQQSRIPESSRAVYENEALSQILDVAINFDSLQVCNLASFELLVRRKQLIADAHQFNPASPSYEGSEHYMGSRYKSGGAIVCSSLTEHVARQLQAESQILKERRKLAEAKGQGRGGGSKGQPKPAAKAGAQAAGSGQ